MYPNSERFLFRRFLEEHKLEEKNIPLSQLKRLPDSNQVALAFDGNRIFDDIVQNVQTACPMTIFTASTPSSVYNMISEYTSVAETLATLLDGDQVELKPLFIFNGCGFIPVEDAEGRAPQLPEELAQFRSYSNGVSVTNVPTLVQKKFAERFTIEEDVDGLIVRRFRESFTDTLRAPYLAWSQIAAFMAPSNGLVSEVFGSLELLAFPGVERVVTNFNLQKETFDCVSKSTVLAALRRQWKADFTEDELSAIILCTSRNRQFRIRSNVDPFEDFCRMPRNPTRVESIFESSNFSNMQKDLFRRNLAALDAPVFTRDGQVVLLSSLYKRNKCSSVAQAFGSPMPPLFYYFIMGGPLLPSPIATSGQCRIADDWPVIDTSAFRRVSETVLPLRVQIIHQIFQYRGRYNSLFWLRQYLVFKNGQQGSRLPQRLTQLRTSPNILLAHWDFNQAALDELREGVERADPEMVYFTNVLPLCGCAIKSEMTYDTVATVLAAVHLRSLDLLGYFTHATGDNESSGPSVYSKALEHFTCETLSEYGVLFIELLRTGALNDAPLGTGVPLCEQEMGKGIVFASRLVSIIPINVSGPWTGPFDLQMAAFSVITRLFSRSLRHLQEVTLMLLFATKRSTIPLSDINEVVKRLPFQFPSEFSAGFLMMYILCNPSCNLAELQKVFPELYALEEDLEAIFWFYSMAFGALGLVAYEEPAEPEAVQMFNSSYALMSDACKRLCPSVHQTYYVYNAIVPNYQRIQEIAQKRAAEAQMEMNRGAPMNEMMGDQNYGYAMDPNAMGMRNVMPPMNVGHNMPVAQRLGQHQQQRY